MRSLALYLLLLAIEVKSRNEMEDEMRMKQGRLERTHGGRERFLDQPVRWFLFSSLSIVTSLLFRNFRYSRKYFESHLEVGVGSSRALTFVEI
jgi:hypothetical protein